MVHSKDLMYNECAVHSDQCLTSGLYIRGMNRPSLLPSYLLTQETVMAKKLEVKVEMRKS